MDNTTQALLLIDNLKPLSYNKKQKLIELFDNIEDILKVEKVKSKREQIIQIVDLPIYSQLIDDLNKDFISSLISTLNSYKIEVLSCMDNDYPITLANIDTPPIIIYYKGDKSLLNSPCMAVVGSRKITNYGEMVTQKFTKDLVKFNFTIVSGLAYGVDSFAHRETLASGGKTIAVLAGGLDKIYPASNVSLAKQIVSNGGLIISEFPPKTKLETHMFPIRNRIIAGLSKGVLITEAYEASGVIHTKNYALDYGRDVFAVMGSIFSEASAGANQMIVNGHAKAVRSVEDIVEEYNIIPLIKKNEQKDFTLQEQEIIDFLGKGEKSFQEMVDGLGLSASVLNTLLTKLSIRGIIKKLAGNTYFLN